MGGKFITNLRFMDVECSLWYRVFDKTFIRKFCQGSMAGAISTLTKNATKSVINHMLDVFFNFTHEKKGRREKGTEENSHF